MLILNVEMIDSTRWKPKEEDHIAVQISWKVMNGLGERPLVNSCIDVQEH